MAIFAGLAMGIIVAAIIRLKSFSAKVKKNARIDDSFHHWYNNRS